MKKIIPILFVVLIFGWSCKKTGDTTSNTNVTPPGDQNIVSKNITTSTFTDVSTSTVAPSGATVKISKPNTPVDGIEIVIPPNSFTTSPTLKISYAEIKSHQFGPNFNPVSPVISISMDGGYANSIMSITVPIKVPAGHIPLGFYLDETTGKLEGIPVNSYTSSSITLLTRHFLPGSKLKSVDVNYKKMLGSGANIIISSISESVLTNLPMISSGFKPGVDDWEFVNYGSYIADGGHCAGQTMAAMWYYFEKKATSGNLFNKFSDNATLWQDNARGYKFCSVLQNDQNWDGTISTFFEKYIDKNQQFDKQKLLTFAGAILVTGEPQAVAIYRLNGLLNPDGTPQYAGHAIICYQVSVSAGKLYISDPNTPGTGQTIDFANNKFSPYLAKLNGNDASKPYPFITYYAKTAVIEWDKIGKRYAQVLDNTIGTIAPNTFPTYTIWNKSGAGSELKDGATVTSDTLRTIILMPTAAPSFIVSGQKVTGSYVFDQNGIRIDTPEGITEPLVRTKSSLFVKLKPGINKLGYYIVGWVTGVKDKTGVYIDNFIDFKWINVNYVPNLNITTTESNGAPIKTEGSKNIKYTFVAKAGGAAAKNAKAKFEWNFGDGSALTTVNNDSTTTHTFAQDGSYTVKCILYNDATKMTEGTAVVKINSVCPTTVTYSGKTYKTVTIGTQCWFKENLDVGSMIQGSADAANNNVIEKYCYNNSGSNCTTYGGLYQWDEAMQYSNKEKAQGICPTGWHIPSNDDYSNLVNAVKNDGNALKAVGQGEGNAIGTNTSGFSGLLSGMRGDTSPYYSYVGSTTFIWTSSTEPQNGGGGSFILSSQYTTPSVYYSGLSKNQGFSIRCLKD